MLGNTDKPIDKFRNDEFEISPYIISLYEFIQECDTPMTIAIQGDWGCGKTSIMNMVRDKLKKEDKRVIDIWFNTWQFSQFNMDNQLVFIFLQHLIKEFEKKADDSKNSAKLAIKKSFAILKNIISNCGTYILKEVVGEEPVEVMNTTISSVKNQEKHDIIDDILELKSNFQRVISELLGKEGGRVIVFIDDLDRLQPVRAIELLEILKLFLDCDSCVFILAIDPSVVFQGIREKYGKDISDIKAQNFFDKMIQLPFKMPVAYYKLDKMINRLLNNISQETNEEYIKLIRRTTIGNPRSIKRIINSFTLIDKVAKAKGIYQIENCEVKALSRKILLSLCCVQFRYEFIYNSIFKDINENTIRIISSIHIQRYDPDERIEEKFDRLIGRLMALGISKNDVDNKDDFFEIISFFIEACQDYLNKIEERETVQQERLLNLLLLKSINEQNKNLIEIKDNVTETEALQEDILDETEGYIKKLENINKKRLGFSTNNIKENITKPSSTNIKYKKEDLDKGMTFLFGDYSMMAEKVTEDNLSTIFCTSDLEYNINEQLKDKGIIPEKNIFTTYEVYYVGLIVSYHAMEIYRQLWSKGIFPVMSDFSDLEIPTQLEKVYEETGKLAENLLVYEICKELYLTVDIYIEEKKTLYDEKYDQCIIRLKDRQKYKLDLDICILKVGLRDKTIWVTIDDRWTKYCDSTSILFKILFEYMKKIVENYKKLQFTYGILLFPSKDGYIINEAINDNGNQYYQKFKFGIYDDVGMKDFIDFVKEISSFCYEKVESELNILHNYKLSKDYTISVKELIPVLEYRSTLKLELISVKAYEEYIGCYHKINLNHEEIEDKLFIPQFLYYNGMIGTGFAKEVYMQLKKMKVYPSIQKNFNHHYSNDLELNDYKRLEENKAVSNCPLYENTLNKLKELGFNLTENLSSGVAIHDKKDDMCLIWANVKSKCEKNIKNFKRPPK